MSGSSRDPRFPHDPDLEFLRDRELLELANLLHTRRLPEAPIDPAFRSSLRRDLRRRHYEMLEPSTPWWRRLTSGPGLAWSGATAGAIAIAVALVFAVRPVTPSSRTLVSSPLDHMRGVAVIQPMKLSFQTAMDHQSVESSLQIQPATQVTYSWRGNTLYVQPVAGQLAPNTQYRLTLTTDARTQDEQPIQQPATITFVTGATTSPTPAPSITPVPAPGVALANPTQLAPAGSVAPVWSADGATLYFAGADGSLESMPRAGGTPTPLGIPGVRQVALAPDGIRIAVLTTTGVYLLQADGTGVQPFPAPEALAVGWRQGKPYAALPAGVFEVKQNLDRGHPATAFAVAADAAAFAPDGASVLVDSEGQVHLVELGGGHDTAWPAGAVTLPAWSQDGRRVAFLGADGLALAAPDGSGATPLASLEQLGAAGATGLVAGWSDGAVLVAGPAALDGVDTTLRVPVQLAPGAFTAVSGSPDGAAIAYVQDGALWTASLLHPGVQPQLESQAGAALKTFMDARLAGDAGSANKFLGGAAAQKYTKDSLLFNGHPGLARWFSVFQQARPDGSVVELVRLVLWDEHHVDVRQLDETLTLRPNADGTFAVVDVQRTPTRAVDAGPEVVAIQVSSTQVTVTFDSDLKPESAAGITLGSAMGTYANRVVTFSLSGEQPGQLLTLTVPNRSVLDLSGRSAAQALTVQIEVPASS